jgi:hypothetical protein
MKKLVAVFCPAILLSLLLVAAMARAGDSQCDVAILENKVESAESLDLLWACYEATGSPSYLLKIAEPLLGHSLPAGEAARTGFLEHSRTNSGVRHFLEEAEQRGTVPLRVAARGILASLGFADGEKSKDGFRAQLWLVPDSEAFFKEMQTPEAPALLPAAKTRRGKPIETTVLFQNPLVGKDGKMDVTYDIQVWRPDGSLYGRVPGLDGVDDDERGLRLAPEALQLGDGFIQIVIEPGDPGGTYRVRATVNDNNRGVSLELEEQFVIDP